MIADELDVVDGLALALAGIDDQPVLTVALALEILADQAAHLRAGAIGAYQITGTQTMQTAVLGAQHGGDAFVVLGQILQLQPTAATDIVEALVLGTHRALQIRLIEGHQLGVPIHTAAGIGTAELTDDRAMHAHFGDHHLVEGFFGEAGLLEDAQRLVVQRDGARHQEDVVSPVDH